MSDADTTGSDNRPEMVQINLRLSKAFLKDIDATWQEQGFSIPEASFFAMLPGTR